MARRDGARVRVEGDQSVARVRVSADRGVFMISVAAELAQMHPQTLRIYEARGLIEPKRSPKGTRLYSQEDVQRLRRIQEMTAELGLNLAGVERVLDLEEQIEALHARLQELEHVALQAEARLPEVLGQLPVRKSARLTVRHIGGGLERLLADNDKNAICSVRWLG